MSYNLYPVKIRQVLIKVNVMKSRGKPHAIFGTHHKYKIQHNGTMK